MWIWIGVALSALLIAVAAHDLVQTRHAILRNFPIIGHFRYLIEALGPELRQYIVAGNDEERPFSRDQRRWIYASSKKENNYYGFGTDNDLEQSPNYLIIKHAAFPLLDPHPGEPGHDPHYAIPCAKVLGAHRGRKKAFRPGSIVNISGMSYGALSGAAVEALNRGARIAGCLQSTGEGGVSPHHRHGGDLVWQLGTGYFGCRDEHGRFSMERFLDVVAQNPIRAVEIKLSQGAKPGAGGILPAAKVTPEIVAIRGVPLGRDCISPAAHSTFSDVDSLLDFAERLADATGLPVGIKSAVGQLGFWRELAEHMARGDRGVDFITIDGGEGGTGAGPLVFTDHVAQPFRVGFTQVYREFAERGLHEKVVFVGSGKLGLPETALFALSVGCDLVNVAREAMLAIGCIQAQRCHTGHCPTGVTSQSRWLTRGLVPTDKAARAANYLITLRQDLLRLARACGLPHPALVPADDVDLVDDCFRRRTVAEAFGYRPGWGLPNAADQDAIRRIMQERLGGAPLRPDEQRAHVVG